MTTEDYEITFATIGNWAERGARLLGEEGMSQAAYDYARACRDVLKILDLHGKPAHVPVEFGE
jgi:uncharacterized lipoprotein NlpE involved in copper resistance